MELLRRQITALGITDGEFDLEGAVGLFREYMSLLTEWNAKINLTAITEPEDIISKHFTDSLTMLAAARIEQNARVLDVGTGAGFPGVPVKILRPDIELTLLDGTNKRIMFLDALTGALKLTGVRTLHARAEDAARDADHREKYDVVCARAVAKLAVLAEYCIPFVKNGGKFISLKSLDANDEILAAEKAINCLGGRLESVKHIDIPFTDIRRSVIIVSKTGHTSPEYPRKANKITKNPIT